MIKHLQRRHPRQPVAAPLGTGFIATADIGMGTWIDHLCVTVGPQTRERKSIAQLVGPDDMQALFHKWRQAGLDEPGLPVDSGPADRFDGVEQAKEFHIQRDAVVGQATSLAADLAVLGKPVDERPCLGGTARKAEDGDVDFIDAASLPELLKSGLEVEDGFFQADIQATPQALPQPTLLFTVTGPFFPSDRGTDPAWDGDSDMTVFKIKLRTDPFVVQRNNSKAEVLQMGMKQPHDIAVSARKITLKMVVGAVKENADP